MKYVLIPGELHFYIHKVRGFLYTYVHFDKKKHCFSIYYSICTFLVICTVWPNKTATFT